MTREQLDQTIKDVCPHCEKGLPTEYRPETQETVHRPFGPTSITLCLAFRLREKYKDLLT